MIHCKEEEIVLRDQEGVVFSLSQRPDLKTRIVLTRENIVSYTFIAPGNQEEHVSNGSQLAIDVLEKFGHGKNAWRKAFKP
jgi:hypothetical protein